MTDRLYLRGADVTDMLSPAERVRFARGSVNRELVVTNISRMHRGAQGSGGMFEIAGRDNLMRINRGGTALARVPVAVNKRTGEVYFGNFQADDTYVTGNFDLEVAVGKNKLPSVGIITGDAQIARHSVDGDIGIRAQAALDETISVYNDKIRGGMVGDTLAARTTGGLMNIAYPQHGSGALGRRY